MLVGAAGISLAAGSGWACSPTDRPTTDGSSTPTPSGPPVIDEAALPSLSVRALWRAPQRTGLTDLGAASLRDGVLYAAGPIDDPDGGIQAIDVRTGTVRWDGSSAAKRVETATKGAGLYGMTAHLAGVADRVVLLGTTYRSPCPRGEDLCRSRDTETTAERGVVALSARDGSVAWTRTIVPAVDRDSPEAGVAAQDTVSVVAADRTSVLIAAGSPWVVGGSQTATDVRRVRTVVLDADGQRRWMVPDLLPLTLAGDVVIALRPTGRPGGLRDTFVEVVGLSLVNGRQRWSSLDGPGKVAFSLAREGVAVVFTPAPGNTVASILLLDPETGKILVELPGTSGQVLLGESSNGLPMAAWAAAGDRGRLLTATLPDGDVRVSARSPATTISLNGGWIHRGYVWCSDLDNGEVRAVDRSGHVCSPLLPSTQVQVVDNDHLVLLGRGDDPVREGFTVYGIS